MITQAQNLNGTFGGIEASASKGNGESVGMNMELKAVALNADDGIDKVQAIGFWLVRHDQKLAQLLKLQHSTNGGLIQPIQ